MQEGWVLVGISEEDVERQGTGNVATQFPMMSEKAILETHFRKYLTEIFMGLSY